MSSTKIGLESIDGSKTPLNSFIKPNWNLSASYTRFNKKVVEIPLDSAVKLGYTTNKSNFNFSKNPSKSSFLILNDGKTYTAYIMTILADSSYLQNDFTKLNHNSYSKRDNNFSGYVLYSTPEGKLLKGWHYSNGQINKTVTPTATPPTGSQQINSIQNSAVKLMDVCDIQSFQILAGYTCVAAGTASPTCTAYYNTEWVITCSGNSSSPSGNPGSGGNGSPSGTPDNNGFPDPSTIPPIPPAIITIKTDSLKKHFPCVTMLIIDSLSKIPGYKNLVTPFLTTGMPNIVWQDNSLTWNSKNADGSFTNQLGSTAALGYNATITLNTSMLQNSSELLIAATSIHETLHGVINYNIQMAGYNVADGNVTLASWLFGLQSWYTISSLPSNFSSHYEMMDYYFSNAVSILSAWDNNAHSAKQYEMAMLYGLDNPGDLVGTSASFQTKVTTLNTEYSNLLTKYGISAQDLNNFWTSQLNAPSGDKLPTTGCN